MRFQFRPLMEDDPNYRKKEEMYFERLKKDFKNESLFDLIRFFAGSFFHDGIISEVKFSNNFQSISMNISCPNIKKSGIYTEPVWFKCIFEGVLSFCMDAVKLDELNDPICQIGEKIRILRCEINSLEDEIEKNKNIYKDDVCSLIFELLPRDRYLSIVFLSMRIVPFEPIAFELLCQNLNYSVPLFLGDFLNP